MILLNLFTAVVLENFEIQEEQAEWTLTPAALEVHLHHSTHTSYVVQTWGQGLRIGFRGIFGTIACIYYAVCGSVMSCPVAHGC